jgi:hypothetical protein
LTLSSSGVIVEHFIPTLCFKMAAAASFETWFSVLFLKESKSVISSSPQLILPVGETTVIVISLELEKWEQKLFFDLIKH